MTLELKPQVKFYCEVCGEAVPVIIEDVTKDKRNKTPWGDILCDKCHFVIATISSETEGVYEFRIKKDSV